MHLFWKVPSNNFSILTTNIYIYIYVKKNKHLLKVFSLLEVNSHGESVTASSVILIDGVIDALHGNQCMDLLVMFCAVPRLTEADPGFLPKTAWKRNKLDLGGTGRGGVCTTLQWRIQDFPVVGRQLQRWIWKAIILPFFPKNCLELKEFSPEGSRLWRPLLRFANALDPRLVKERLLIWQCRFFGCIFYVQRLFCPTSQTVICCYAKYDVIAFIIKNGAHCKWR